MDQNELNNRMVLLADVSKRRVVVLRLAVKQFKQALFVLSDRSQIADITKQMKKCCEAMKQLAPQKTLDVPFGDPLDEIEYEDHIFNPAKLVHRKSQTHRRISNRYSGCPPMKRGRHFDRKRQF